MSLITVFGPDTMYDNEEHVAIAGTPGSFLGGVFQVDPANFAELVAEVRPSSADRWVNGQYVVLLNASEAYWDGSEWQVGRAPNNFVDGVAYALSTSEFTSDGDEEFYPDVIPTNLAALIALDPTITGGPGEDGLDPWTGDDASIIQLGNDSYAYWDGTTWQLD